MVGKYVCLGRVAGVNWDTAQTLSDEDLEARKFVIDVFARRIVGWRVSACMHTDFVLDALEQALCERKYTRQSDREAALIHHSDRGSQPGVNWSSQHFFAQSSVAVH